MNSVLTIPLFPSSCIILKISFTTLSTSSSTGGVGSLPSSSLTETMMTPQQQLLSQALCSFELLTKFKQNIERIVMELRQQKRIVKRLKRNGQSDMRKKKLMIAYLFQSLKRDYPQYHSQPLTELPLQVHVHDVRWEVHSSLVEPLRYMMYSFCIIVLLILVAWVRLASGLSRRFAEIFENMNGGINFDLCMITLLFCVSALSLPSIPLYMY